VGLKSNCHRFCQLLPCAICNVRQHPRVGEVYAVKIADGYNRRPEISRYVFQMMKSLHVETRRAGSITGYKSQISNSSFIPSYESFTLAGNAALVCSWGKSWQICVKNARRGFSRSTMRNEFSTVECVG
jgi:hypothetical protein